VRGEVGGEVGGSVRQTSLVTILVFAAGLGSGYFARGAAGMLQRRTPAADVAAIERLNREDIEATLAQDPKRLVDLWAEDAVAFYPGSLRRSVGTLRDWRC
jgi:hypothetical protein